MEGSIRAHSWKRREQPRIVLRSVRGFSYSAQLNRLKNSNGSVPKCEINFRTDAREGDRFEVLLQERYYGDEWISGTVMYASYRGKRTGFYEAFRYTEDDPKSSYNAHYTPDGEALIHSGLRYPLDSLHIMSAYGMRVHPVTGRRQMHNGVDYRARPGTNVHAVAKGTVIVSSLGTVSGNTSIWSLSTERNIGEFYFV